MTISKERTEEVSHSVEKDDIDDSKDSLSKAQEAEVENYSSKRENELEILYPPMSTMFPSF